MMTAGCLQVWRREVPVDVFAASDAGRHVAEGLGAACDPRDAARPLGRWAARRRGPGSVPRPSGRRQTLGTLGGTSPRAWERPATLGTPPDSWDAGRHVAEGLGAFCEPLVDVLDEFEQQLQLNRRRLVTSIDKMHSVHADYEHDRLIDHQFVL